MAKERLVIIGGDAAGMSAGSQAKRLNPDLEVTAFERSPHTSYSACGIPYFLGKVVDDASSLIIRPPETFREKYDIRARVRHEVIEIDTSERRVRVRDLEKGREWNEPYDQLLIATGAAPQVPDMPGSDAAGIFGLGTLQSGLDIERFLEESRPERAVIVGGGYIGLEMAEALMMRGIRVSLVHRGAQVMKSLDRDMGKLVSEALDKAGVSLYLEEEAQGFDTVHGRVSGVVTDRRTISTDLVVFGLGVRPVTAIAQRAGIPLGARNAIRVNTLMQTEVEGVWAAGDCAESFHLVSRRPVHIPLGTIANRQGRVAGVNLGGGYATFPGVMGTAMTRICHLEVARTGLREDEIRGSGLEFETAVIESRTMAGYYPGASSIFVKLLAEKGTGRLLGGQIVGGTGSAKRIDVLAVILHGGMTIGDIINLDLGYAPPFSPVWDPIQTAARVLEKKI